MTTATATRRTRTAKVTRVFNLTKTEVKPVKTTALRDFPNGFKDEEHYTYTSEDGTIVAFHAHPTAAFCFVPLPECSPTVGQKLFRAVADAWMLAGMDALDNRAEGVSSKDAFAAGIARLSVKV